MPDKTFKTLVVSVGGTPSPIIFALNKAKPDYICFFISEETKKMMEENILPGLRYQPRHHDWIMTPNPELLSECYGALMKFLPPMLEKWQVSPEEVCVDYTGGTKTMSAALVLATVERSCCYSYVGGSERSKGGVGVVLDGKERMHFLENPWDQIAATERKEAAILFNRARYASASETLERCVRKVSLDHQPLFRTLKELVDGYGLWDQFRHREAKVHLYRSKDVLAAVSIEKAEFRPLVNRLRENLQFLETLLAGKKPSIHYFYDLLSNARRRADLEHKFEDAVARLYRAIEVIAQVELQELGIDSSAVPAESIPEPLREEFLARYRDKLDGRIRLPLYASFRLLEGMGSEKAGRFFSLYESRLKSVLEARNSSILAHGFNPVERSTFDKLWGAILEFSATKAEQIPEFPILQV